VWTGKFPSPVPACPTCPSFCAAEACRTGLGRSLVVGGRWASPLCRTALCRALTLKQSIEYPTRPDPAGPGQACRTLPGRARPAGQALSKPWTLSKIYHCLSAALLFPAYSLVGLSHGIIGLLPGMPIALLLSSGVTPGTRKNLSSSSRESPKRR
jgi:hypothetical protein